MKVNKMIGKQALVSEITKKLRSLNNFKKEVRVEEFIDSFLESLEGFLVSGERIIFQNLFSLNVVVRGERRGKNPRNGEEIIIPERKSIGLRISPNLKEKINKSK